MGDLAAARRRFVCRNFFGPAPTEGTKLTNPGRMADFDGFGRGAQIGLETRDVLAGTRPTAAAPPALPSRPTLSPSRSDTSLARISPQAGQGLRRGFSIFLGPKVSESMKCSKAWPTTAQGLGNRIERVKPLLRQRGIIVERKHSGERIITIVPRKDFASAPQCRPGAPVPSSEELDP